MYRLWFPQGALFHGDTVKISPYICWDFIGSSIQQLGFPAAFCDLVHESSIISIILVDHLCCDLCYWHERSWIKIGGKKKVGKPHLVPNWVCGSLTSCFIQTILIIFVLRSAVMGFQKIRDILRAWKSCQLPKVSENVFPKTVLLKSDICVALSFLVS